MNIIAFTGAGISADSGIPTFEELGEDFRRSLSRSVFRADPDTFYRNILKLKIACDAAALNAAHIALAEHGVPIITMNIDGLHRRAGTQDLIEIHGGMDQVRCQSCGVHYPFLQVEQGCFCPACNGLLLHDIVLYEDSIPRLQEALTRVEGPGILLVVGTSFYTSTASYVVDHARTHGRRIVLINEDAKTGVPEFLLHHHAPSKPVWIDD